MSFCRKIRLGARFYAAFSCFAANAQEEDQDVLCHITGGWQTGAQITIFGSNLHHPIFLCRNHPRILFCLHPSPQFDPNPDPNPDSL